MGTDEALADPERAFWLLSDQTRIAILQALWEASNDSLSFTVLRERVGNPNSGQFNYHLGKLRGHFVSRGEDGYTLTQAGREVVRAVLAGSLTDRPHMDATPVDARCPECGAPLVVRYDEYGIVECSECGSTVMWNEFPPAGLAGRRPREVAMVFDTWTRTRFHLAMEGICPSCACEMTVENLNNLEEVRPSTDHRCQNCKYEARVPLFGHVIRHPAVVSFFYERGTDIANLPYWELRMLAREFEETILNDDPWMGSITVTADDARLRLTLNERLEVIDAEISTL
jgi:ssDNA-binding Zn-finger/Zn-ribbon topoisomerase 1